MDRPYVVMAMTASVDARIALGPGLTMFDKPPVEALLPDGEPGGKEKGAAIEAEWHPQGEMMGSGTVLREGAPLRELPKHEGDPRPLHEDYLPEDLVQSVSSWAILVDGRGRCRSGYTCKEEGLGRHILHLASHAAPAEYFAFLQRERIPYLVGGERHVDLPGALRKLRSRLGIQCLRLIGGGTLNGAMLRAGLIDEVHLTLWPALFGGDATPTLADCADLRPGERPARLQLVGVRPQANGYVWLHYRVEHDA